MKPVMPHTILASLILPSLRMLGIGLALTLLPLSAVSAAEGGLFAPRVMINNSVVTNYEVEQRAAMLKAFNSPGDLTAMAIDQLIEDRLRLDQGTAQGIKVTEAGLQGGMAEFAARNNETVDAFVARMAEQGVSRETFRDFVKAGMVWREVIRVRFGSRAQVSDAEVDRALALSSQSGAVRVLLSEIILPATDEYIDRTRPIAERISKIRSIEEFSEAARQASVSPTRENGGKLDWLPLTNLPEAFASQILALSPGQVTEPLSIPNALLLFQLRAIEVLENPAAQNVSVEYARFFMPDARIEAADKLRARVDTCDDLYGVAKGLPEERLQIETHPIDEVPKDIATELAKLDENEVSTRLVNGSSRVFLMLCGRTAQQEESPSRDQVRQRLTNQRLNSFADGFLQELRADAFIRFP
ncbi:peptidyl-prolyl cis-trans isomerase SurA [Rhodobacteraceae bacterium MBR-64]